MAAIRLHFTAPHMRIQVQSPAYSHTALGIKGASIGVMGGKGGFLTAPRSEGEHGFIAQHSTVRWRSQWPPRHVRTRRQHADTRASGNSWPYSGLERRELKGGVSRRV
jgi:hypothetical protein